MDSDDPRDRKRRKKAKKDKWGQPVVSENAAVDEDGGSYGGDGGGGEPSDYEPNKVVVSGMPYTTTEKQIRNLFKDAGRVVQLQLSRFPDSGNFRGLAFVTFETEATTDTAVKLDGIKMGNRFLKIERCRVDPRRKSKAIFLEQPKKVEGSFSSYIGNLSWDITEDEIRDFFKDSKIDSIRLSFDKRTGVFRGFCHIDFDDDESLENAMQLDQSELHGRPLKISYAVINRN